MLFEHGEIPREKGDCGVCIHHAHIHLIPDCIHVEEWLAYHSREVLLCEPINIKSGSARRRQSLFVLRDHMGMGCLVKDLCEPPPHQFVRRIIAEHHNNEEWDWNEFLHSRNAEVQ